MTITMVKKVLADGSPCRKCVQAEEMLKRRKLWDKLDEIVIADERDPSSEGFLRAKTYGIETAPFFVVQADSKETIYTSPLELIREVLKPRKKKASLDVSALLGQLDDATPQDIVRTALTHFGKECAIAFSGAEDVALIQMAADTGLPFSAFCLDTGRLHNETLGFIEDVQDHYGIHIQRMTPDVEKLQAFVTEKGLFSFFVDGHKECCGVRKVEPLRRALKTHSAWITGQRKDQSATRVALDVVENDNAFEGKNGALIKFNPLSDWTSEQVWSFLREKNAPTNPLHDQGFRSIGCEPCTRPTTPEQHEREGRWWWEDEFKKECGLHLTGTKDA